MPEPLGPPGIIISPYRGSNINNLLKSVFDASYKADIPCIGIYPEGFGGNFFQRLPTLIQDARFLIFDISFADPRVLYSLGYCQTLKKPIVLISNQYSPPLEFSGFNILYFEDEKAETLIEPLYKLLSDLKRNPEKYTWEQILEKTKERNCIFISYSHSDIEYISRLRVHLKPLDKKGKIEIWDDKKIKAGEKWKEEIEKALKRSKAAIFLISADFLASDFIVENELPPLLLKAKNEGLRIIPIIVKPCGYLRDPNLKSFQAINDPEKPLSSLNENDREVVFDKVTKEIEEQFTK